MELLSETPRMIDFALAIQLYLLMGVLIANYVSTRADKTKMCFGWVGYIATVIFWFIMAIFAVILSWRDLNADK